MNKMDKIERKAAGLIQKDINAVSRPFKKSAQLLNLDEAQFIHLIKKMYSNGLIRRFGAILRHQKAGYKKNALVAWSVPADKIEKTGKTFSSFSFVSHCYERDPFFKNKYNIFTMVHGKDEDIAFLVSNMSASTGINNFLILESIQEYKKSSQEYF